MTSVYGSFSTNPYRYEESKLSLGFSSEISDFISYLQDNYSSRITQNLATLGYLDNVGKAAVLMEEIHGASLPYYSMGTDNTTKLIGYLNSVYGHSISYAGHVNREEELKNILQAVLRHVNWSSIVPQRPPLKILYPKKYPPTRSSFSPQIQERCRRNLKELLKKQNQRICGIRWCCLQ